ncbi:MAG TPA: M20/M25/M40 family metallo-hydrolase [Candidatus Dormibacteraeota bacterium]|nr:M20/M25/M40 family metallo-hydrolase [Candidatus Dormibacteraeota bacterium]
MDLERALGLVRERRHAAEAMFLELLRIPSVSTAAAHRMDVRRACAWLSARLEALGFEVVVADDLAGGHPVLRADWNGAGAGGRRLTIYGHYDVQPPDPLEAWTSPPFDPVVRDGVVYARGAADSKCHVVGAIAAAAGAIEAGGPPVNLRLLLDGEEEIAGRSLAAYLGDHAADLATDFVLLWDGAFLPDGRPSIDTAMRGALVVELDAVGSADDLHSGEFGGNAPNAINTLARIVGDLKRRDGFVTIPGFYDRVRMPPAEEMADWDRSPEFGRRLLALIGAPALEGEPGFTPAERAWCRPTLDAHGIIGGFVEEGTKMVIPRRCRAKVSMRLVPDQEPMEVFASLREYVADLGTPGVVVGVRLVATAAPLLLGANHPGTLALAASLGTAYDTGVARLPAGGSIPVAADFARFIGAPMMSSGIAAADAGVHAPDEHIDLDRFHRGVEALVRLMWALDDS